MEVLGLADRDGVWGVAIDESILLVWRNNCPIKAII